MNSPFGLWLKQAGYSTGALAQAMQRGFLTKDCRAFGRVKRHKLPSQMARQPKITRVIGADACLLRQLDSLLKFHMVLRDIKALEQTEGGKQ
jgi:hypothetical protein